MASRRAKPTQFRFDAKTIGAITALVLAVAGGVELRVQVGVLAEKSDAQAQRLMRIEQAMGIYNLPTELAKHEQDLK
jgi:hypothetical protein